MNTLTLFAAIMAASLSAAPALAQGMAPSQADGKTLFMKNCAACHQASGKGIPGAFPALAGNAFVQGAPAEVSAVLLKGRGGMPDFSNSLDDAEIAQVLAFVRSSWGNGAAPPSADEVAATRASLGVAPASHGRFGNKH
jgi:mono/diheme cytochrome c family protein